MAEEHSSLWGGLVDLDPHAAPIEAAGELLAEIRGGGGENQVAYRGGRRHVARLLRADRVRPVRPRLRCRTDAGYLITGGLGDLGLEVAGWLVERGARRLILLGRTELPPRSRWGEARAGTPEARRIERVLRLEAAGASVHLAAVDVGSEAELRAFLERYAAEGWPPIRGVVHAAGVAPLQTATELESEDLHAVLRPKVLGGWLLHRLLADRSLDFFVLFSSFAALLGSPRLSAYAAGNAFVDALANERARVGLPALSVNWGGWAEVGMAARELEAGHQPYKGVEALTPPEALEVLGLLLRQSSPQIGVMAIDWREWRRRYPSFTSAPLLSELAAEAGDEAPGRSRPRAPGLDRVELAGLDSDGRRGIVVGYLADQLADVLGLEPAEVDVDVPTATLGIDSLMAFELAKRIETDLGAVLPSVTFLQGPSVSELATSVLVEIDAGRGTGELEQLSDDEVAAMLGELRD